MEYSQQELQLQFKRFWKQHEENNRFLWGMRSSSLFARGYIEGHELDAKMPLKTFLRDELKGHWRKSINLKHYKGPYVEGAEERPELLIEHFMLDMKRNSKHIYQYVIIGEIRALEILLNGIYHSIASYILASDSVDESSKLRIGRILNRTQTDERYSVALKQLADLLPTLGALLEGSTYKREKNPFLSTKINGISCLDAVQMWKEIRNLVIHRDGQVSHNFSRRWSKKLIGIMRDDSKDSRVIHPGSRISISLRQTMFCLTTCHQTAVLLYIASGASNEQNNA